MSIVEKLFHYNKSQVNVVKCDDEIWFKGKDIANALGYENPGKAIREHVDPDDNMPIDGLLTVFKGGSELDPPYKRRIQFRAPFKNRQGSTIYINESGLYTLILTSKLKSAKVFKK